MNANKNILFRTLKSVANHKTELSLVLVTTILYIINIMLFFPGYLSGDSISNLNQALGYQPIYGLQPVILPISWAFLIQISGAISSILIFQLALLWASLCLLSLYSYQKTRKYLISLLFLSIGFMPIIINISGVIWSDNIMAFGFSLSVAMLLISNSINLKYRKIYFSIIAGILIYSSLHRNNAIFGLIPLLVALIYIYNSSLSKIRLIIYVFIGLIFTIFFFSLIRISFMDKNIDISPTAGPQADDIVHIMSYDQIANSNIPDELKNSLVRMQNCVKERGVIVDPFPCGTEQDKTNIIKIYPNYINQIWKEAIKENPTAYLQRRALVYIYVLFPPEGRGYIYQNGIEQNKLGLVPRFETLGEINKMYVFNFGYKHFGFLYEPWFWLLFNSGIIIYARKIKKHRILVIFTSLSGVLYILSFIPTGIAADYRYIYWPVLSGLLSVSMIIIDRNTIKSNKYRKK